MATKTRKRKKSKAPAIPTLGPTPERQQHNHFQNSGVGLARRVVPMIDTLRSTGRISESEWAALLYYRQQADACARSPIRDSCDFSPRGGNGDSPIVRRSYAKGEVERMDRLLGNLRGIVQAVAVDDLSLTQWAIKEGGSKEEQRGDKVRMVPKRPDLINYARWDLKFAAKRIER